MFKTQDGFQPDKITSEVLRAEKNYIIQKNDYLKLDVFTNKGERAIDPNPQLSNVAANQAPSASQQFTYLVDLNGIVKFPMVGELKLEGLTLRQAEEILQKEYEKYFNPTV